MARKGIKIHYAEAQQIYHLSGCFDPYLDIFPLLESPHSHLILNLQEIKEINSIGIKKWVEALQALQDQGKTIEYQACSPVVVRQCNFIPDITKAVTIHSFQVMFECEACDTFQLEMLLTKTLDMENLPPEVLCPECGEPMLTEEFKAFDFLTLGK